MKERRNFWRDFWAGPDRKEPGFQRSFVPEFLAIFRRNREEVGTGLQALRFVVYDRHIARDGFRLEVAPNYQYLASLFEAWRFQAKNAAKELADLLRRTHLTGSAGGIPPPTLPTLIEVALPGPA